MATTADNPTELLPAAEPAPPPNLMPDLPAPPGVSVTNAAELMPAERTAAASPVTSAQTTRGQLADLLGEAGSASQYIQQAEGAATRYAASRGLQNSSIAAQAGRAAAIDAALPIAGADAGVYERRELQRVGTEDALTLTREQGDLSSRLQREGHGQLMERQTQAGNIESRLQAENAAQRLIELAQAGDITSRQLAERFGFDTRLSAQENLQRLQQLAAQGDLDARARLENFQNQSALLTQQTAAEAQMQQREIASRQWLAQFDASTQKELQAVDLATRERMQAAGFSQERVMQELDAANQRWLAQFDASTRERLQALDADVRFGMQQLDLAAQERIAGLELSAAGRNDAARAAVSLELGYSGLLQTIMNNPDIPADARQSYMDHASRIRDSNLGLVEQLFDFQLEWA